MKSLSLGLLIKETQETPSHTGSDAQHSEAYCIKPKLVAITGRAEGREIHQPVQCSTEPLEIPLVLYAFSLLH